jgi:hypothetical protein
MTDCQGLSFTREEIRLKRKASPVRIYVMVYVYVRFRITRNCLIYLYAHHRRAGNDTPGRDEMKSMFLSVRFMSALFVS